MSAGVAHFDDVKNVKAKHSRDSEQLYEAAVLRLRMAKNHGGDFVVSDTDVLDFRITSYNVCYTKLLRLIIAEFIMRRNPHYKFIKEGLVGQMGKIQKSKFYDFYDKSTEKIISVLALITALFHIFIAFNTAISMVQSYNFV